MTVKNIFFVLLTFSANLLLAQKIAIPTQIRGTGIQGSDKNITDTLWNGFKNYTPTLYEAPNGGFLSGNNGYGDIAKGQIFALDASIEVAGAIYWFGYKAQNTNNSTVSLKYFLADSTNPANIPIKVPNTLLDSINLSLTDIPADTSFSLGALVWLFDNPIITTDYYCFSVFFDELVDGDTLALFNSSDGQAGAPNRSVEFWNGRWRSILNNWDVNADFAIFPLVDSSNVGLSELEKNLNFVAFPNPFYNEINLNVDLPTANQTMVLVEMFDLNGVLVHSEKVMASEIIRIQTHTMKSGVYFLRINGQPFNSKKLIKN